MKNILILALVLFPLLVLAQPVTLKFDEVDSISSPQKTISIEDLRDHFNSIEGVKVINDSVEVNSKSDLKINFRDARGSLHINQSNGGDMGGG